MEPCNAGGSGCDDLRKTSILEDEIKQIGIYAAMAICEIRACGGTPYIKALQHCIKHVASGGTLETFKPLVRTNEYAGRDRRK